MAPNPSSVYAEPVSTKKQLEAELAAARALIRAMQAELAVARNESAVEPDDIDWSTLRTALEANEVVDHQDLVRRAAEVVGEYSALDAPALEVDFANRTTDDVLAALSLYDDIGAEIGAIRDGLWRLRLVDLGAEDPEIFAKLADWLPSVRL